MTPIERAARALHRSQEWPSDDLLASMSPEAREDEMSIAQQVEDDGWQEYVADARAVIAAIRAPGADAMGAVRDKGIPVADALDVWQTAIDKLLEEGE
jgi:hypothetical protein